MQKNPIYMILLALGIVIYPFILELLSLAFSRKEGEKKLICQFCGTEIECEGKEIKTIEEMEYFIEKEETELADDLELVAVISAAIAAYEGSTSTEGFVVRSIKKSNKRSWKSTLN